MAKYRHAKGPSALQIIIIVLVAILSLAVLAGAAFAVYNFVIDKEPEAPPTEAPTDPPATVEEVATEPPTEEVDPFEQYAKELMAEMSEDDKIYQMLIVTPETLTGVDVATVAGDATKEAIKTHPVGGIFYTQQNFEDTEQTTDLIKKSQSYANTPMFIAVNEQGGDNSPVATALSTAKFEIADNSVDMLKNSQAMSKDLQDLGFNLNLGVVGNISGDDAYATDTTDASSLVASVIEGQQANGIIPALKCFPSLDDTDKDAEKLSSAELIPFDAGIQAGVPIIMTSYANITAIDKNNPAFMSSAVADMLTDELKFDGIVMTPDLSADAIADTYSAEKIVVGAINAGADILLTPSDIEEYVDAIKTALKDGDITIEQIDKSVTKILALKHKYGIIPLPKTPTPSEISQESTQVATNIPE